MQKSPQPPGPEESQLSVSRQLPLLGAAWGGSQAGRRYGRSEMHTRLLEGSVGSVSLDAASRMGLIAVTFTTEATWPGPTVTLSEFGRSLTH